MTHGDRVAMCAACRAVRDRLTAVLKLLNELASGNNANRAVEARSLLVECCGHAFCSNACVDV